MIIAKYSGTTGAELWQYVPPSGFAGPGEGTSLVINSAGDVFAGGSLSENPALNYPDFVVLKLSGARTALKCGATRFPASQPMAAVCGR